MANTEIYTVTDRAVRIDGGGTHTLHVINTGKHQVSIFCANEWTLLSPGCTVDLFPTKDLRTSSEVTATSPTAEAGSWVARYRTSPASTISVTAS